MDEFMMCELYFNKTPKNKKKMRRKKINILKQDLAKRL